MASQGDKSMDETPLFYTLARHKSSQIRKNLSQLFLEHSESSKVDLGHKNKNGKTVYEAYAADIIE